MAGFVPYKFQEEDIELLFRQKAGLIGSEMGTGKTHEAIELDQQWYPYLKKPTLVIAPLRTFDSWRDKYAWQAPHVDVVTIDRKNRERFVRDIRRASGDVFLMHWDALRLLRKDLQGISFGTVIADEVHRASNRKAQATLALRASTRSAGRKLGLSGTASGDKPEGLWSINNWLWPSYYTSYWRFRKAYTVEEDVYVRGEKQGYTKITGPNFANLPYLQKEMAPWYVRHLKREKCCEHHPDGVMPWLKPKVYDQVWVDLSSTQRRIYDQMKKDMVAWVGEHENSPLIAGVVVAQLTRLSQIALAVPVVQWETKRRRNKETGALEEFQQLVVRLTEESSKVDALIDILKDNPDKKFMVVSSSKQICYIAQKRLAAHGISSFVCSGDTPEAEQKGMVHRFNNDRTQVFLGVIAAMAEGIDGLQESTDTMIFLDRHWSTLKNKQCEDRLHRDGQLEAVQIIDIIARNTIDLGKKTRLEQKWSWIKTILGDKFDNVSEVKAA